MKRYKVEHTVVDKKYRAVMVEAKNETEAISLARQLDDDHFEESEQVAAHEWTTRREWSFSLILKSLFGRPNG